MANYNDYFNIKNNQSENKNSLVNRLKKLFAGNIIIKRNPETNKLKIADFSHLQSDGTLQRNSLIDRYQKLHISNPYITSYDGVNTISSRMDMYADYEMMEGDPLIAAALDIYADETTMKGDTGESVSIISENQHIQYILYNLFYDVLNIEFNLWSWVRNMTKYGDYFLHLDIKEGLGIVNAEPISAYDCDRIEGNDPAIPNHVEFKILSQRNTIYDNHEIAHFRLLSDSNYLPYGRSMIEPARKVWKALSLLEDAMLINRIMRAPEKRVFKIDVGNIPPHEVDAYMQKIITKMKRVPYINPRTGQYNLEFNMQNMMEDYFLPVRGGQSGTEIDSTAGFEFGGIDDIIYLKKKMLTALKIPPAFLGIEGDLSGKATLAAEDLRFARTIERLQRIVISELTKIAIIHLYAQGYTKQDLLQFEITMTSPSILYEQEKLVLYASKVDLAGSIIDKNLLPKKWVYKNIFNFTDDQIADMESEILADQKWKHRVETVAGGEEDPMLAIKDEPISIENNNEGDADIEADDTEINDSEIISAEKENPIDIENEEEEKVESINRSLRKLKPLKKPKANNILHQDALGIKSLKNSNKEMHQYEQLSKNTINKFKLNELFEL